VSPAVARSFATLVFVGAVLASAARPAGQPAGSASAQPADSALQQAADSVLEARTSAVAAQLRCAVCQGLSIQDSPSELAQQMRTLMKEQLRAGKSENEVKAYFVSKYGEFILLEPRARGFNLVVYVLPVLLVVGGLGGIVLLVRRWTRAPEASR